MDEVNKVFTTNPTLPEGIILQAVRDWRHLVKLGKESAVLGSNGTISLAEIREFFKSDWCAMLCGKINPLFILKRLEKERVDALNGKERKTGKKAKAKAEDIRIEYNGETHTIREWAKITGMTYYVLYARLVTRSWAVDRAFTTPVKIHNINNYTEAHT